MNRRKNEAILERTEFLISLSQTEDFSKGVDFLAERIEDTPGIFHITSTLSNRIAPPVAMGIFDLIDGGITIEFSEKGCNRAILSVRKNKMVNHHVFEYYRINLIGKEHRTTLGIELHGELIDPDESDFLSMFN